jgi:enoyl-CoA hydratase
VDTIQTPEGIRLEIRGAVARVTLDRPGRHNAIEAVDVSRFRSMLDELERDDGVRVLVLTGTGDDTFSSGASLQQIESGEMSGAIFDTLTDRLERLRVPSIAALNGSVYGGGAELALCCDFRVGVQGMHLSVPAARLGICYPVGGLTRYVERLGISTANRILLAAEEMADDELLRVGFLTHLVEREAFEREVNALADRLASLAPLAVQSMKRLLLDISKGPVDGAEADRLIQRCADSPDHAEGLEAWREKRDPVFRAS